jgi:predicted transcriptional regulator
MTSTDSAGSSNPNTYRRDFVLNYLREHPEGATAFDIEAAIGIRRSTVSPLLGGLEELGLICRDGSHGLSPKGCVALFYRLPEFVPVEKRMPVIRRAKVVVNWYELEAARKGGRS